MREPMDSSPFPVAGPAIPNTLGQGRDVKPHETARREELVEQILAINTSASPEFLSRFTSGQLKAYLDHLSLACAARTRPWIRPERTPPVVWYRAGA